MNSHKFWFILVCRKNFFEIRVFAEKVNFVHKIIIKKDKFKTQTQKLALKFSQHHFLLKKILAKHPSKSAMASNDVKHSQALIWPLAWAREEERTREIERHKIIARVECGTTFCDDY